MRRRFFTRGSTSAWCVALAIAASGCQSMPHRQLAATDRGAAAKSAGSIVSSSTSHNAGGEQLAPVVNGPRQGLATAARPAPVQQVGHAQPVPTNSPVGFYSAGGHAGASYPPGCYPVGVHGMGGPMPPTLPESAWTGVGSNSYAPPCGDPNCQGPWQPDGIYGPWPYDEYIWDGGDRDVPVKVDRDWTVRGIDEEDTIAHYDTLKGRTEVVPSNRVPIYAPRFAAVRKVQELDFHEGHERVAGTETPVRLNSQEATRVVTTSVQQRQPILQHNMRTTVAYIDRTRGLGIDQAVRPLAFDNRFLPYEDFLLIRRGQYDGREKALLAERAQAAIVWTSDQMVQVILDGDLVIEAVGNSNAQETVEYHRPDGSPALRIVKVASKSEALPGEIIDFTLRFDNIGNERIGNVTIIDSLTTRLEYIEGSAQCNLKSRFGTQDNEAESLLLRWEITDPLEVGEGGIVRFKCRLR